ncbi:3-deoxy-manno-octulosonate cytidylyltransferase [Desulfobulbus oligotrophicus]|jgi:3-deoxy-manno-octulosonate cytidylyltransferase (CMP-KDO synthetase)|uniref:3-deoxy-manno-octulosonate cytidylyltransferase n=1 Tax=Desulfobulbus oligotrophicus TaxID=1909699 RepID=A0A7T5VFJ4_9BACT|nr:3-deoxy-manno-octulosonate cytidylyltransferase [Desulfobulbus oligotrophicus]MDY0389931.1 3-deoxy-manno-octulosonate cytidylyltransferase [Desulfobulbus oligotrophicus]QQG66811.1 3-deoxy-manno-octulosonate cytidylyltransferase [Desulfobulbus oligotrophicus]
MNSSTPKIVAIIPARYHSNRFEGKPLALIQGRPMIQHVVERAWQVSVLTEVVVATDDERIAQAVTSFGGRWVMTRRDHATGTDRLAEAAHLLALEDQDIVVNIQGDQPVFPPEVIEQVVGPLVDDPSLPMSTLIYKIIRPEEIPDPNHVKTVFDCRGNALYFSRAPIPFQRDADGTQQPAYYKHLGVYAYRKNFLTTFVGLPEGKWEQCEKLEQLRALEFGYTVRVVLTEYDSVEVDTFKDLERVEQLLPAAPLL